MKELRTPLQLSYRAEQQKIAHQIERLEARLRIHAKRFQREPDLQLLGDLQKIHNDLAELTGVAS